MPRIPLCLEMRPVTNRLGPVVYLGEGLWEISFEGIVDSELELISQGLPKLGDSDVNRLPGNAVPLVNKMSISNGLKQIAFKKAGSEGKISVFATLLERNNGTNPS